MSIPMLHMHQDQVLNDVAKLILGKLDPPTRKSEIPAKPIVVEFMGLHKAGKDTNLVELDRWFKRRKYNVLIHQESAETKDIRTMSRTNAYVYEMRHFAYTFSNLLSALTSRDFHLVIQNRGFVDTLCWLELHRRQKNISTSQFEQFRSYILNGPWVEGLDAVVCLMCSVETSLKREYGTTKNVIYGSRMNPESLTLMRDCVESVFEHINQAHPNLPLVRVNTDDRPVSETREEIIGGILDSVKKRLELNDSEIISHSPALLRELAKDTERQEVKFRGIIDEETLLAAGWLMMGELREVDTYLTPKNQPVLENDECFHLRFYGDEHGGEKARLMYKRREESPTRHRITVPILRENVDGIFTVFDQVAVLEKQRALFVKGDMVLTLDRIKNLGEFVEMRAPVSSDVMGEATKLGLTADRMIPETYIRLFLKQETK